MKRIALSQSLPLLIGAIATTPALQIADVGASKFAADLVAGTQGGKPVPPTMFPNALKDEVMAAFDGAIDRVNKVTGKPNTNADHARSTLSHLRRGRDAVTHWGSEEMAQERTGHQDALADS